MPLPWSLKKIEGSCSVEGCDRKLKAKGLCDVHYGMNRKFGRTHAILRSYSGEKCEWDGCEKKAEVCGYCRPHYKIARRTGVLRAGNPERDHPLYGMWWTRRKAGTLSQEWESNFSRFIQDVGDKPGKNFSLVKLRDGPFGPDNFKWHEQIKRQPGETPKEFFARKWQAQKIARPSWDRHRQLARKYGVTPEWYEKTLAAQDGKCAICQEPETRIDHRGTECSLAVDHCHTTLKVRGLLCSRCNQTIGKINESIEILRAMETYLIKHQ